MELILLLFQLNKAFYFVPSISICVRHFLCLDSLSGSPLIEHCFNSSLDWIHGEIRCKSLVGICIDSMNGSGLFAISNLLRISTRLVHFALPVPCLLSFFYLPFFRLSFYFYFIFLYLFNFLFTCSCFSI